MSIRFWAAFGRGVVGLFSLALLTSIGGAGVAAAPLTLPALWFAARDASTAGRILLNVVAVLTAAELGWGLAYLTWGDAAAATRVVPVLAAAVVTFAFPLTQRSRRRLVA